MTAADAHPETAPPRLALFPVTFFATVMGLAGLTLALHAAETHFGWAPLASRLSLLATLAVFVALAGLYALKALRHRQAVHGEWMHPVKLAFFPAITISLLLIATALRSDAPALARLIWMLGTLGQGALTLAVLSNWIGHRPFQAPHVSPAWFIPAVGNVIVPIAGVPLGFPETSWVFFSAGLIFWIVLLTLVMNRLIFHEPMPGKMTPTIAILIAPPAVAFLSWLQLNGGQLDAAAHLLYGATLSFLGLALTQAPRLRRVPFALSWWALSFPVAALTIATFRYAALTGSGGHAVAATVFLAALVAIVAGLVLRTLRAIARNEICVPE